MEQLFVVMSPVSGEIFGGAYEEATALGMAKGYGPGVQVLAYERDADNKWNFKGDLKSQKSGHDEGVREERTRILGCLAAFGVDEGLVKKATVEGLSMEQGRHLFAGKSDNELWGPKGRGAVQDDPMAEWSSRAVQASFGGNRELFETFKKYEALGCITMIGNKGRG